jgi:hypothetical protein
MLNSGPNCYNRKTRPNTFIIALPEIIIVKEFVRVLKTNIKEWNYEAEQKLTHQGIYSFLLLSSCPKCREGRRNLWEWLKESLWQDSRPNLNVKWRWADFNTQIFLSACYSSNLYIYIYRAYSNFQLSYISLQFVSFVRWITKFGISLYQVLPSSFKGKQNKPRQLNGFPVVKRGPTARPIGTSS